MTGKEDKKEPKDSSTKDNTIYYRKGIYYSVTISPNDKIQGYTKPDRMRSFRNIMHEILISSFTSIKVKYDFEIELSEPRGMHTAGYSGPRLHLHGVIKFNSTNSIKQFLLYGYYKLNKLCAVDIDVVEDLDVWSKYCRKQSHIMKEEPLLSQELLIRPSEAEECNDD